MNINKIINKIKDKENVKTDREISELFGISPQDFAQRKKRGSLISLIINWGVNKKVDLNWLLSGEGEILTNEGGHSIRQSGGNNAMRNHIIGSDSATVFQNNGTVSVVKKGGGGDALEKDASLKAMRLITRIMDSGNPAMVSAAITQLETLVKLIEDIEKKGTL